MSTPRSKVVSGRGPSQRQPRVNLHDSITKAFESDPEIALTTKDLVMRAYGVELEAITRSQRVAAIRAMKSYIKQQSRFDLLNGAGPVGQTIIYDAHNVMSYALARLKEDWLFHYQYARITTYAYGTYRMQRRSTMSEADLKSQLTEGSTSHRHVVPGGAWYRHTEQRKAEARGDHARVLELQQEQEHALQELATRIRAALGSAEAQP
jgi:hypothetical protein